MQRRWLFAKNTTNFFVPPVPGRESEKVMQRVPNAPNNVTV